MIIRIQSKDGTKRIEANPSDTTKTLYEKAYQVFELNNFEFSLYKNRDKSSEIISSARKTIKGYKLAHGDMLFLTSLNNTSNSNSESFTSSSNITFNLPEPLVGPSSASHSTTSYPLTTSSSSVSPPQSSSSSRRPSNASQQQTFEATNVKSSVEEDEVDQILSRMPGRVERSRNPMLCRHLGNSRCIHCSPLDPWDDAILKENKIKHLSFHAYLRKMSSGVDKGKFTYLDNLQCRIRPGCMSHPPWPQGICSKCQPSAVTLNRQTFRHVDNVTFENPQMVERFINYWRVTGHQRIGMLYGKHMPHLDVPLGIKASVCAIYEPPQEGSKDHVKLLPNPNKELVDEITSQLGMSCAGWIFTDLVPLDASKGTVRHLRHSDSYFLSAHEVIMAGHLQNEHPNRCKQAPEGIFGSKFTTVIITGDKNNQVHMEGYQVSNQCQALVRDRCLVPTKDMPQLAYVKESSQQQYVPDVYFKEKDRYGNEVVRLGRPLPVEYLLLDCPVSTPNEPIYTFANNPVTFPVENRLLEGHLQDLTSLTTYLQSFTEQNFIKAVSDLHLLIFIASMDMLPLREFMGPLLKAVKNGDAEAALKWKKSDHWATVEQLLAASNPSLPHPLPTMGDELPPVATGTGNAVVSNHQIASWTCSHCTFINQNSSETCDMCHLPR